MLITVMSQVEGFTDDVPKCPECSRQVVPDVITYLGPRLIM